MPAKKTSLLPTRIITIALRPPTQNARLFHEQLRETQRYRNQLVEVERNSRERFRKLREEHENQPDFQEALRVAAEADQVLQNCLAAVNAYKVEHRTKRVPKELSEPAMQARKVRQSALHVVSVKRKALNSLVDRKANEEQTFAEVKAARSATPLYWGSYLLVERSHEQVRKKKGGDPEFKRRAPLGHHSETISRLGLDSELGYYEGRVGVQLQGQIPLIHVFGGANTSFQLERLPYKLPEKARFPRIAPKGEPKKQFVKARIRIGSNGRAPIWAEFPGMIHQKLPSDAIVKWAWVRVRKIGTRIRYDLQLSLESATFYRSQDVQGVVAVDLNWRQMEDGSLRVAYARDDQGRESMAFIPADVKTGYEKAESLTAIRKRAFNDHHSLLLAFRKTQPSSDWFLERTEHLHQWLSLNRMAFLVSEWHSNRFEGDEAIFTVMEAWRRQDRHLLQFEAGQRTKSENTKKLVYRRFASSLAGYQTLILEDFDLRDVAERDEAEENKDLPKAARHNRQLAAPSIARNYLIEKFGESSVEVAPSEFTTMRHYECGHVEKRGSLVNHTCSACAATFDQDSNACKNILNIYFEGDTTPLKEVRAARRFKAAGGAKIASPDEGAMVSLAAE